MNIGGTGNPMSTVDPSAFTSFIPRWSRRGTYIQRDSISYQAGSDSSASLGAETGWIEKSERDIKELLLLDVGWDGDGAFPVTDAAVEATKTLVKDLYVDLPSLSAPFITASAEGGIALEWSRRG